MSFLPLLLIVTGLGMLVTAIIMIAWAVWAAIASVHDAWEERYER